jgi:carbon storage regulator
MLVLRRRAGESLLIGDDIEIELLELTAQGAKIGIRAPRETIVLRKELKITEEQNAHAAQGPAFHELPHALEKLSNNKLKNSLPRR